MSGRRWLAVTLLLAVTAVMVSGCGQDEGADDPSSTPSSSQTPPGPPTPSTSWQPQAPAQPVDTAAVKREYDATLEAAVASVDQAVTWPSEAELSTERFAGLCVVKLERVGTGTFSPDVDALQQALATAVSGEGFDDLALENDPGGALMFVAHDSRDALFEFRSKGETTVAVRVATADSECAG